MEQKNSEGGRYGERIRQHRWCLDFIFVVPTQGRKPWASIRERLRRNEAEFSPGFGSGRAQKGCQRSAQPSKKVVALKSIVRLDKEGPGTLYLEPRIWWFFPGLVPRCDRSGSQPLSGPRGPHSIATFVRAWSRSTILPGGPKAGTLLYLGLSRHSVIPGTNQCRTFGARTRYCRLTTP